MRTPFLRNSAKTAFLGEEYPVWGEDVLPASRRQAPVVWMAPDKPFRAFTGLLSITGPREPPKGSMNCKNGHVIRMTGGTKWNPNMKMIFISSEGSSALSSPHPTQFSSPSYGRNSKTAATVAENLQSRFGTVTTRVPPGLSARHISRTACIGFKVCSIH